MPGDGSVEIDMSSTAKGQRRTRVRMPVAVLLAVVGVCVGGGAATGIARIGLDDERKGFADQLAVMQTSIDAAAKEAAAAKLETSELRVKLEAQSRQLERIERQFDSLNDFLRRK